ncbi:hypothetical protein B0A48_06022 [Cryoendolithus antarcticus]|uniref:Uncharacterized protein n=1 Tax=Cryoendolithus antarcticus TaxID=1507870 RepID=A0A1V8TD05_9PEZI|nr:hypothetical protein B0A48_06022 [Cryoendolithus antarcticus]
MQPPASARPNTSKEVHKEDAAANKMDRETKQPLKSALKVSDPSSIIHHNPTGGPDQGSSALNDTTIDFTDTLGHAGAVMRQAAALLRYPDDLTPERGAYQGFEHAAMELGEGKKLMAKAQQEMAHAVAVQKAEADSTEKGGKLERPAGQVHREKSNM